MKDFICPSILSADFARLGEEVKQVLVAGADVIHFDVMDNHYVPNLTVGPVVCESLRRCHRDALLDVHLMVDPVDSLIEAFGKAGADWISFHPEASQDIDHSLQLIQAQGCKRGLVFNPETPLDILPQVLDKVDMVLIMSVHPGFGGQAFLPEALTKIEQARELINASGRDIRLQVDGGIKIDNIGQAKRAGADTFVAGSAIFHADDYRDVIRQMRRELETAG